MVFRPEKFIDIITEVMPLLVAHYHEISANQDIPLEIDQLKYQQMCDAGVLKIFTARCADGRIIGYAAYFVNSNAHYKSSLQASQDVIYIDAAQRGFGAKFIQYCDDQLRDLGVQVVYHHVKVAHNWGHMLERMGYKHVEHIYSKRLDKSEV